MGELKSQGKLLSPKLKRQRKRITTNPQTDTSRRTSAKGEKLELQLVSSWKLSADRSEGDPVKGHFCEIYLKELYQVLMVNTGERSSHASSRGMERVTTVTYDIPF